MSKQDEGKTSVTSTINFFPPVPSPSFAGTSHGFFWFGSSDRRVLSVYRGKTGLRQYTTQLEKAIQFCTTVTVCANQFLAVGVGRTLSLFRLATGRKEKDITFTLMPTCCCSADQYLVVGTAEGGVYLLSLALEGSLVVNGQQTIIEPHSKGVHHGASVAQRMGRKRSTVTCLYFLPGVQMLVIGFAFGGFQCWTLDSHGSLAYIYASAALGSTPVSHITALEQGQREVLICVCCSITSAPFLKGFPWPEEYPLGSDEEGSFSIIRLRSAQSIQHAEIADNQILSEGSTTRTIASFVGAQGLAYGSRSFILLAWSEFDKHRASRIHSVLIEALERGSIISRPDIPNILAISDQFSLPVYKFNLLGDTVACLPTSLYLTPYTLKPKVSALSFSALLVTPNTCTIIKHSSSAREFLNELLQVGPSVFSESRVEAFYTRARAIDFFNIPERSKQPNLLDMQRYLYNICLFFDLTPLLVEYVTSLRTGEDIDEATTRFITETRSSPFVLQNPAGLSKWAKETFRDLSNRRIHWEERYSEKLSPADEALATRSLQEILVRMADIDSIFQELRQRENTTKGLQGLDNEQAVIQLAIQRLELLLWFQVEKGLKPFHLPSSLNNSYACLSKKYSSNIDNIRRRKEEQQIPRVVSMKCDSLLPTENAHSSFISRLLSDLQDGSNFSYPPASVSNLLDLMSSSVPFAIKKKRGIVLYTFFDLRSISEGDQCLLNDPVIQSFCQRFLIEKEDQQLVYGFWLLDNLAVSHAVRYLKNPEIALPHTYLTEIFRHLHDLKDYPSIIEFVQARNLSLCTVQDAARYMKALLATSSLEEAFQFVRRYYTSSATSDREYFETLLYLLFDHSYSKQQMPALFRLPFSKDEEEALKLYLADKLERDYLIIAYYLQRGYCAVAIEYYDSASARLSSRDVPAEIHRQILVLIDMAKKMLSDIELKRIAAKSGGTDVEIANNKPKSKTPVWM